MLISQLSDLVNISSRFNIKSIISRKEADEIELSMSNMMDIYINENPLEFSSPHFEDNLKDYVITNMTVVLKHLYDESRLILKLESIYNKLNKYYFSNYYPIRSYSNSFIRKKPNVERIKDKLLTIENKPQPTQKSDEWYLFRHNLITASSAWKIFKSQSAINQLIVEKCKTIDVTKYDTVNTSTPMHHGNKYEDVSIMFYEHMYNTKVQDYGCIQHDTYPFLGASPDGINIDPTSDRYGRMLEIKNPTTREITCIPKEEYWIQMQLQMETCDLNECDFLETVFKEYDDEQEFMADGTFTYSESGELKGIIVYFMMNGKPLYEYMPLYLTKQEYDIWYDMIMDKHNHLTWITTIYWKLEDYSCILVLRNKYWFKHAIPEIEKVWQIIEKEKKDGYEHRLPKKINKRVRSDSLTQSHEPLTNHTCLINIDSLN
jgi:putative phage-type endonuclease